MLALSFFITDIARPTIDHCNAEILDLPVKKLFGWAKFDLHHSVVDARKRDNRLSKYPGTVCTAVQYGLKDVIQPLSRRLVLDFEVEAR